MIQSPTLCVNIENIWIYVITLLCCHCRYWFYCLQFLCYTTSWPLGGSVSLRQNWDASPLHLMRRSRNTTQHNTTPDFTLPSLTAQVRTGVHAPSCWHTLTTLSFGAKYNFRSRGLAATRPDEQPDATWRHALVLWVSTQKHAANWKVWLIVSISSIHERWATATTTQQTWKRPWRLWVDHLSIYHYFPNFRKRRLRCATAAN